MSNSFFRVTILEVSEKDLNNLIAKFGKNYVSYWQLPKCRNCGDTGYIEISDWVEEPLGPSIRVGRKERCPSCNEEEFKLTSE